MQGYNDCANAVSCSPETMSSVLAETMENIQIMGKMAESAATRLGGPLPEKTENESAWDDDLLSYARAMRRRAQEAVEQLRLVCDRLG